MILLLLNWGPLSFFVAILPCMWLLTKPWGLRYGVVYGERSRYHALGAPSDLIEVERWLCWRA